MYPSGCASAQYGLQSPLRRGEALSNCENSETGRVKGNNDSYHVHSLPPKTCSLDGACCPRRGSKGCWSRAIAVPPYSLWDSRFFHSRRGLHAPSLIYRAAGPARLHSMSYDSDVATFDPQGRIQQVNYAMEAPKLGAPSVGICNGKHAVLVAVSRQASKLSGFQEKLYPLDAHVGCCVSGIYADARKLIRGIRQDCLEYEYLFDAKHPVRALVLKACDRQQARTQFSGDRPFGVSLLVAGIEQRPGDPRCRLFQMFPDGNLGEFVACAVGSRSQSATTYLLQHEEALKNPDTPAADLIRYAMESLGSTGKDTRPTKGNLSVGIVSLDELDRGFHALSQAELDALVERFDAEHPEFHVEEDTDDLE